MPLPPESGRELDQAVQHAAVEHRRAVRAAEIATRHEAQMATAAEGIRGFHGRMAAVHRQVEQQHRTAARIHTVHADRLRRWGEGSADPQVRPGFMAAVALTLGASGAALTLFGPDEAETLAAASDPASRTAQGLEFTLGEGPARETARLCRPITAAGGQLARTWPVYGPAVENLGIRAVAAVPVATAGAHLGALTVFDPPRAHGPDLEMFQAAADTLAVSLLPPPWGAPDGREPMGWPPLLDQGDPYVVVNQAAGMVSVQCRCSIADALALIRAHAFAENRPVDDVAAAIVDRTLRLG